MGCEWGLDVLVMGVENSGRKGGSDVCSGGVKSR